MESAAIAPSSLMTSSIKSNMPYEIRLGEEMDVGVQYTLVTIFTPFPLKYDVQMLGARIDGPYVSEKLNNTRFHLRIDADKLKTGDPDDFIGRKHCFLISDQDSIDDVVYVRTQNGFQKYVTADFKKSETAAAIASVFPGMGYYYAEEEGWALGSGILRLLPFLAKYSDGLTFAVPYIYGFLVEAKSAVDLVNRKNGVAHMLMSNNLTSEADLLKYQIEQNVKKEKKIVKYPKAPFGVSYGGGIRIFPAKSADGVSCTLFTMLSIGLRDYYSDSISYNNQIRAEDSHWQLAYYDDFYSFGWKNIYLIGIDTVNNNKYLNLGVGKDFHTEWVDFKSSFNFGQYDNPVSLCLEGVINFSPLTYFEGNYVEVHSPY